MNTVIIHELTFVILDFQKGEPTFPSGLTKNLVACQTEYESLEECEDKGSEILAANQGRINMDAVRKNTEDICLVAGTVFLYLKGIGVLNPSGFSPEVKAAWFRLKDSIDNL